MELKPLDTAIDICQRIYRQLGEAIKKVRKLNIANNPDWVLADYRALCADRRKIKIREIAHNGKIVRASGITAQKYKKTSNLFLGFLNINYTLSRRSSCEIMCSNSKINTKFIKFRRSFESVKHQLQRIAIVSERQGKYQHILDRTFICNH